MPEPLTSYYGPVAPGYGDCYRADYGDRPGDDYPANRIRWEWVRRRLKELGLHTILEVGCGEGTPMQLLQQDGFEVAGFDSEPAMVEEAKRKGLHVWQASVLDSDAAGAYDAVTALGPLPHLKDAEQLTALRNIGRWLTPGGHAYVELRNELFSLLTFNRYTADLLRKLLPACDEAYEVQDRIEETQLLMDQPPQPTPGSYGAVFSRFNNPLELDALFSRAGLRIVQTMYYHFHAWPPAYITPENEAEFRSRSRDMEWDRSWRNGRGIFQASALIVEVQRI